MITKVEDIRSLITAGRARPGAVFAELQSLAASVSWQTREVAATGFVEIAKRQPDAVLTEAARWASDPDANVRRAAIEGLRGLVKTAPGRVRPVLEILKTDPSRYVQKSVANVLRNASSRHPEFVLALCREWATGGDPNTWRIIIAGLRKLERSHESEVATILGTHAPSA